jgi:hypothetical protein
MKYKTSTGNLDFDGMAGTGVNGHGTNGRLAGNQYTGHSNDGRLVQKGQMPNRKGNDGTCSHSGMAQGGKTPPTAALSAVPAQGSVRDSINRGAPNRGPGGVMCKSPANPDKINVGSGPRKGNQQ